MDRDSRPRSRSPRCSSCQQSKRASNLGNFPIQLRLLGKPSWSWIEFVLTGGNRSQNDTDIMPHVRSVPKVQNLVRGVWGHESCKMFQVRNYSYSIKESCRISRRHLALTPTCIFPETRKSSPSGNTETCKHLPTIVLRPDSSWIGLQNNKLICTTSQIIFNGPWGHLI